jgi:predicted membrane protein
MPQRVLVPFRGARNSPSRLHLPSLVTALVIMCVATLYPPLLTNGAGHADIGMSLALFFAMSAGFVRGVGFMPRASLWRGLFSGWACTAALTLAGILKFLH